MATRFLIAVATVGKPDIDKIGQPERVSCVIDHGDIGKENLDGIFLLLQVRDHLGRKRIGKTAERSCGFAGLHMKAVLSDPVLSRIAKTIDGEKPHLCIIEVHLHQVRLLADPDGLRLAFLSAHAHAPAEQQAKEDNARHT